MRFPVSLTLVLISSPLLAQTSQVSQTSQRPSAPATDILSCVNSIRDQSGTGCLQAASEATFGRLTPYPGLNNSFDPLSGSVVSGGENNEASGTYATVAGGLLNYAQAHLSTVAGGGGNFATDQRATIGGGDANSARGRGSTIPGGVRNTAEGNFSTIAGGWFNRTTGAFSFAAGRYAFAAHTGSFVWSDSGTAVLGSSREDEFNVYASGGTRIFSDNGAMTGTAATGVLLAPGGGSWTSVSDRNAKENFEEVDGRAVLHGLASIPITTWNYKAQDEGIRHMGPMSQDVFAAFGLGVSDTGIDTIDADGIALAAIQGLKAEKDAEVARLTQENEELRARVEQLESLGRELASLKAAIATVTETR